MTKIYDLLNVFVPFNDQRNNSNFLFLPFVWANNLFQDWTKDPGCDAQDSSGSADGRLSCPSKKQADRKRALILIVNKPDWFEPNELTYLGFDNDFSEIPMIESDCIRFDINYSDTSRKFADGSSYNGTICGAKKILYYTTTSGTVQRNPDSGYYETSGSATGRLTFPKKHLIKIVVEPVMSWEKKSCNMGALFGGYWYNMGRVAIAPFNGKNVLFSQCQYGQIAYSIDGVNWTFTYSKKGSDGWFLGAVYGDNGLVVVSCADRTNGIQQFTHNYNRYSKMTLREARSKNSFDFGNGIFMIVADNRNIYTAQRWNQWSKAGTFPQEFARVLCYASGKWIAGSGNMYESYDNGKTWHFLDSSLGNIYGGTSSNEWYGAAYYRNYFYVVHAASKKIARSANGKKWQCIANLGCNTRHKNITNYNDKLYCFGEDGACCHVGSFNNSSIRFNISGVSNGVGSSTYTINDRKEFFIEPSQLSSNQLTFNMTNIRLISAEITNRPYTKVKPECRLSNSGNNAYITTNVRKPVRVTLNTTGTVTSGSVTFGDVNSSNLSYKGTQSISNTKSFTFPASNFENNWKLHKLSMSLSNASVVSMSLANQTIQKIRCVETISGDLVVIKQPRTDEGGIICDKELETFFVITCPVKLKAPILFGSAYLVFDRIFRYYGGILPENSLNNNLDIYCDRLVDKDTLVKLVSFPKTKDINAWTCFSVRIGSTDYTPGRCSHTGAVGSYEAYNVNMDLIDCPERRAIVSGLSETDKYLTVDLRGGNNATKLMNFTFTNTDTVPLGKKTDANSIWVENDGVYFVRTIKIVY